VVKSERKRIFKKKFWTIK